MPEGKPTKAKVVDHAHELMPTGSIGTVLGDWRCVRDGCGLAVMGTPICDETFWSIVTNS